MLSCWDRPDLHCSLTSLCLFLTTACAADEAEMGGLGEFVDVITDFSERFWNGVVKEDGDLIMRGLECRLVQRDELRCSVGVTRLWPLGATVRPVGTYIPFATWTQRI